VKCAGCKSDALYRFCSSACFIDYAKKRIGIDCQVCPWMPLTRSVGNPNARGLCPECRDDATQRDWEDVSALEQRSDDVELDAALSSAGSLSDIYGGERKAQTEKARRVLELMARGRIERRRRRRTRSGHTTSGWVTILEPLSLREIAKEAGVSYAYVRFVIKRQRQ
jgi:hypothetical protein